MPHEAMGLTYNDGIEDGVAAAIKVLREMQAAETKIMDDKGERCRYDEALKAEHRTGAYARAAHEIGNQLGGDPQEVVRLADRAWA